MSDEIKLSDDAKRKFPHINTYIHNLKYRNITQEYIKNEIESLNGAAVCEDPMPFSQRLGTGIISSMNPLGPLGFFMGYMATCDQCPTEYRQAQYRYETFSSKL